MNAIIWVRQGKTRLALANISGAMMIQATVPSGIGLLVTPWRFDTPLLLGAGGPMHFLVSGNVDETDTDPNAGLSTMDRDNAAELAVEGFHVERRTVPVRRLDDVLEEAGVPVGFGLLKIDVEGYERAREVVPAPVELEWRSPA